MWAQQTFGSCELGDTRRTDRLVTIGIQMAQQMGESLAKSCEGNEAALLGGYRFMRNDHIKSEAISEGGFKATAKQVEEGDGVLLALEDTTTVSYKHAVASTLGITSSQKEAKRRGFLVHSVLLVAADSEKTLGLIE